MKSLVAFRISQTDIKHLLPFCSAGSHPGQPRHAGDKAAPCFPQGLLPGELWNLAEDTAGDANVRTESYGLKYYYD